MLLLLGLKTSKASAKPRKGKALIPLGEIVSLLASKQRKKELCLASVTFPPLIKPPKPRHRVGGVISAQLRGVLFFTLPLTVNRHSKQPWERLSLSSTKITLVVPLTKRASGLLTLVSNFFDRRGTCRCRITLRVNLFPNYRPGRFRLSPLHVFRPSPVV